MFRLIINFLSDYGTEIATLGIAALIRWLEKKKLKTRSEKEREELTAQIEKLKRGA